MGTTAISLDPAHAVQEGELADNALVQPVQALDKPSTPTGCTFLLAEGPCGQRTIARGLCQRHYRQLARRKAFEIQQPAIGTTTTPTTIRRNQKALDKARDMLEKAAPVLVSHLLTASERAAMKGKHAPAAWGLLHGRAVEPIEKTPQGAGSQGVKVFVGFSLGSGLTAPADPSRQASVVQVLPAEAVDS